MLDTLNGSQSAFLKQAREKVNDLYDKKGQELVGGKPTASELNELVNNASELTEISDVRSQAVQKLDEKVAIATQMYDLVDHHIRRLDADLANYECLLKQNDELEIEEDTFSDEPTPALLRQKKVDVDSSPLLSRSNHFEDIPTPTNLPTTSPKRPEETSIDPNEPVYCTCRRVSYGQMVACDNEDCVFEWFHYECVGLKQPPIGKWYCVDCTSHGYRK